MKPWSQRSAEQRTLLNPAYLLVLISDAAGGHKQEENAPMPYPYAFLAAALSAQEGAFDQLPANISTSVFAWLADHPASQVQIVSLANELVPASREAIRLGIRLNVLTLQSPWGLEAGEQLKSVSSGPSAIRSSRKVARFAGRWLGRAGDPGTVLAAWGLSV
jgi:Family of unknown function (DUF6521)